MAVIMTLGTFTTTTAFIQLDPELTDGGQLRNFWFAAARRDVLITQILMRMVEFWPLIAEPPHTHELTWPQRVSAGRSAAPAASSQLRAALMPAFGGVSASPPTIVFSFHCGESIQRDQKVARGANRSGSGQTHRFEPRSGRVTRGAKQFAKIKWFTANT